MLDDMLALILSKKCPRTSPAPTRPNRFKLLYSDRFNPKTKKTEIINLRRSFKAPLYPFPSLNPMGYNPDFLKEKIIKDPIRHKKSKSMTNTKLFFKRMKKNKQEIIRKYSKTPKIKTK
jgi:hypothetical protein